MENIFTSLIKSVLVSLGLTASAWTTDAAIQKKSFGFATILVFSNVEIDDITKTAKFLEDVSLLIKSVSGTVEKEIRKQKGGFRC